MERIDAGQREVTESLQPGCRPERLRSMDPKEYVLAGNNATSISGQIDGAPATRCFQPGGTAEHLA
jgi:hypothetical protein